MFGVDAGLCNPERGNGLSDGIRNWLFRIGSFLIAGILLYLALKNVDFDRVGKDLVGGRYIWVVPLIALTLLSHVIRAWRWRLLLCTLPNGNAGTKKISLRTSFYSLMIGYMANYAAPRIGEVVRSANFSAQENRPFGGVFGTVVAERILDVFSLGLALLTLPLVLGNRTGALRPILFDPLSEFLAATPGWLMALIGLGFIFAILVVRILWKKLHHRRDESRFRHALESFRSGLSSLQRAEKPVALTVSTILMWACYSLMAYLPLVIFDLTHLYHLTVWDAWGLMLLGSIGVVIPSPGGIGSYHYITIQSLVILFAVPQESAASYAIFTHAGQLILYVIVGFTSMLIEGASWSDIMRAARTDV